MLGEVMCRDRALCRGTGSRGPTWTTLLTEPEGSPAGAGGQRKSSPGVCLLLLPLMAGAAQHVSI